MGRVTVEIDEPLAEALAQLGQPVDKSVRELVVLELYRRELISSGKAAELLGMTRLEFIQYSGALGIPFYRMSEDEWEREVQGIEERVAARRRSDSSSQTAAPSSD